MKDHSSRRGNTQTQQNEITKINKVERNKEVDLDNLPLYDCIQEQEDDWVSSVIGSETDALNDLF